MSWFVAWFSLAIGFVAGVVFGATVLRDVLDGLIGWPSRALRRVERQQAKKLPRAWAQHMANLNKPTVLRRRR